MGFVSGSNREPFVQDNQVLSETSIDPSSEEVKDEVYDNLQQDKSVFASPSTIASPTFSSNVQRNSNSEARVGGSHDAGNGTVFGKVTIGPLCPVEPCPNGIENPYLSREIRLQSGAGQSTSVKLNADGSFLINLKPGTYTLTLTKCEFLGCDRELPMKVIVEDNKTTTVEIDIDTGIRSDTSFKPSSVVTESISPSSGSLGTEVVISGSGFTTTGNDIAFTHPGIDFQGGNTAYLNGISSPDGKILRFNLPDNNNVLLGACAYSQMKPDEVCPSIGILLLEGVVQISVVNKNGESNSLTFTVRQN